MPPPPSSSQHRQLNPFLARLEHMTFAWFTSCMSLGGMANLLMSRIIDSSALYYVGTAMFLINVLYLVALVLLQIIRFTSTPASFSYTLSHPIECCFLPTAVLACATVIIGLSKLVDDHHPGRGWQVTLCALFWIYFGASVLISLVCYTSLFSRAEQSLHHMNPAWVLPIFPLMLCGSIAAALVPTQTESAALVMSIAGLACQGLGFTVSIMMYAVLLLRLMTVSFPPPRARPGLFMNVGPPAFTIICLLGLSSEMQRILPALSTPLPLPASAYETLAVVALASSVALWSLSAWFYLLTVASLIDVVLCKEKRDQMEFILAWWACVFPVTGFATATAEIGDALASTAISVVAQCMVGWLLAVFVGVAAMHVRAVVSGGIMAQGKDEDRVIDTMHPRFQASSTTTSRDDVEKDAGAACHAQKGREQHNSPYSNPPTYPSTPAMSVTRLDTTHAAADKRHRDADVDTIHPLPPAAVASSSSAAQLKMTPLSASPP